MLGWNFREAVMIRNSLEMRRWRMKRFPKIQKMWLQNVKMWRIVRKPSKLMLHWNLWLMIWYQLEDQPELVPRPDPGGTNWPPFSPSCGACWIQILLFRIPNLCLNLISRSGTKVFSPSCLLCTITIPIPSFDVKRLEMCWQLMGYLVSKITLMRVQIIPWL